MAETVTLQGDRQFLAFMTELFVPARREFVRAAPELGIWPTLRAREAAGDRMRRDGTDLSWMRKLFGPAAVKGEPRRRHLRELADRGAAVRIAGTALPHESIVIDQRIAILAGPDTSAGREYTVTTAPSVIAGVYALFEAAWETATGIEAFPGNGRPLLDIQARMILRTLGSGLTDAAAAEKLGLSLRTYRRRVAELLDTLGADTRFEAGLRAGELGLVHDDVD